MIDPVQNIVQNPKLRRGFFLAAVAMQLGCGLVFTLDITSEWGEFTWHNWAAILGVIGLVIGASVTLNQYCHLLRRTLKVERELGAVSGAFQEMI